MLGEEERNLAVRHGLNYLPDRATLFVGRIVMNRLTNGSAKIEGIRVDIDKRRNKPILIFISFKEPENAADITECDLENFDSRFRC